MLQYTMAPMGESNVVAGQELGLLAVECAATHSSLGVLEELS